MTHASKIKRRTFLKASAVSGLLLAMPELVQAADPVRSRSIRLQTTSLNLAVIQSGQSSVADSIKAGLALALGTNQAWQHPTAGAIIEQLTSVQKADAVLLLANSFASDRVCGMLPNRAFPMLELNAGEMMMTSATPNVTRLSLGYWQSQWALGAWAAANKGKTAHIIASMRESGFDGVNAFRMGFEQAGGTIISTSITHRNTSDNGIQSTLASIKSQRADVVYVAGSGSTAYETICSYRDARLASTLLVSSFALDGTVGKLGRDARGIISCASWLPSLKTQANTAFMQAYAKTTGQPANSWAMLGYDAGLTLQTLHNNALMARGDAVTLASPRGTLTFDPASSAFTMPLLIHECRATGNTAKNSIIATVAAPTVADAQRAWGDSIRTGWLDTYA